MKNFARHLISRHTQPENNINPRLRGLFEPEPAGSPSFPQGDRPPDWSSAGGEQGASLSFNDGESAAEPKEPADSSNAGIQSRLRNAPVQGNEPDSGSLLNSPDMQPPGNSADMRRPGNFSAPRDAERELRTRNAHRSGNLPSTGDVPVAGKNNAPSDRGDRPRS